MTDPQISPSLGKDKDKDNKPLAPEMQVLDTALDRLLAIDKVLTDLHAIQAVSELKVSIP
jgi:hypothetical protein